MFVALVAHKLADGVSVADLFTRVYTDAVPTADEAFVTLLLSEGAVIRTILESPIVEALVVGLSTIADARAVRTAIFTRDLR